MTSLWWRLHCTVFWVPASWSKRQELIDLILVSMISRHSGFQTCMCFHNGWQLSIQHHTDVIMTTLAFQITSLTVVYSAVYSDADQRKHQSSASLAGTGEFPAQRASYAENVSIWWRHHELHIICTYNWILIFAYIIDSLYISGVPPTVLPLQYHADQSHHTTSSSWTQWPNLRTHWRPEPVQLHPDSWYYFQT